MGHAGALHRLLHTSRPNTENLSASQKASLRKVHSEFNLEEAKKIKEIEKTTNHDVKAVEYYLKNKLEDLNLKSLKEFVHFALTSQDINNTATPLLLRDFTLQILLPKLSTVLQSKLSKILNLLKIENAF